MDADVIVVGAGPAGAATACALARDGLDVILMDRRPFPRDKACGDGVPPGSVEILNSLGMADRIREAQFNAVSTIRLGSPSGRTWDASFRPRRQGSQFYIAPRFQFDALVKDHAVRSGARFVCGNVKGPVFSGGRVAGVRAATETGEAVYRSRVVVGADGATSVIGRALRPTPRPPLHRRSVAIRGYADGIDADSRRVEFYFYRRFLPGYGWVFPLGEGRANVGVIMRADRYRESGASLERLLGEFMETPAMAGRLDRGGRVGDLASWQLPNAGPGPDRNAFDGALLVGDAGGMVDPLTGEGIHNALVSALLAARAVAVAVRAGDASLKRLESYDRRCREVLGPLLARSHRVHRWADGAPWWIDFLFMLAKRAPRSTQHVLNRMSNDFVIRVDG